MIQRGHNGCSIANDVVDQQLLLRYLEKSAFANDVSIHAYRLLNSEMLLLATPKRFDSLSRMMQSLGRGYGAAFNRRHGRSGGLWDGRFRSVVIDPEQHLLSCMRFVDALSRGDLAKTSDVRASSAEHHLGQVVDSVVTDHRLYWELGNTPFERQAKYRELLHEPLSEDLSHRFKAAVLKGWPLGSDEFLSELSMISSRRLRPLNRGRPKRS
jgi:putative transposase